MCQDPVLQLRWLGTGQSPPQNCHKSASYIWVDHVPNFGLRSERHSAHGARFTGRVSDSLLSLVVDQIWQGSRDRAAACHRVSHSRSREPRRCDTLGCDERTPVPRYSVGSGDRTQPQEVGRRQDNDRSAKWLLAHHGDAILKLEGITGFTNWKDVQTETVVPRRLPNGLIEVRFPGESDTTLVLVEIETAPDSTADRQVLDDLNADRGGSEGCARSGIPGTEGQGEPRRVGQREPHQTVPQPGSTSLGRTWNARSSRAATSPLSPVDVHVGGFSPSARTSFSNAWPFAHVKKGSPRVPATSEIASRVFQRNRSLAEPVCSSLPQQHSGYTRSSEIGPTLSLNEVTGQPSC